MAQHIEVAAVVDIVEQATVPLFKIDRFEEDEVTLKANLAISTARSEIEIDDRRVGRVVRVNGVEEFAPDLLLGSGRAIFHSVGKDRARGNLDPFDFPTRSSREDKQTGNDPDDLPSRNGHFFS